MSGKRKDDILLAACYRAYAALPSVDASAPMSIMSMMDLRRHCKNGESEGLCNMSGSLPTVLKEGVAGDFSDTLGGPLKKKPAMQVSAISFDGAASLAIVGRYTKTDGELLQQMLDCMVKEIEAYTKEPV